MTAIVLLILYMALMIAVGVWGMKKTSTLNDFFLGGRSIGPWISAFAYGTSYFSAVVFIGFAGKLGWGFGPSVLWIAFGNTVFGSLLAWIVLGRRTRRMTQNLSVMTMPEFLSERVGGKYIKIVAAIIVFVFLLPYSASVFKGLGHLFEVSFGIPYDLALLIMILVTGVYLVLGGYFAITLTDLIQGVIMIAGSIAMISILTGKAGGFSGVISRMTEAYVRHVPAGKGPSTLLLVSLVLMTSFGTWGLPQMVQKFYAVKNEKIIKTAAVITTIFAFIIGFSAYYTGALSHLFYESVPLSAAGTPDFDRLVPDLLVARLPEALLALILLLVLSASMSTLSSLVLVSASSVSIDLYKGHINPEISKENSLIMIRFLSAVFVAISYFIARFQLTFIVYLMSLSWGAVAGAFMAPYLYCLYWKRTTRQGVMAGMVTGLVTSVSLYFILGEANSPIASVTAMILPFFTVPAVSLLTAPPAKDLVERAFEGVRVEPPARASGRAAS